MDDRAQLHTLDSAVLTPLVRRAYQSDSIELGEWSTQQIHSGAGEGVGIYRIKGQGLDKGLPSHWSLILKVLGQSESSLDPAYWGYWRREAEAYQSDLVRDLPANLKTPNCFEISEPTDGIVWLWLEDVPEEQGISWGLNDYARVARQFGQFNGKYLDQQSLPAYPWLSRNWLRSWVEENASAVGTLRQALDGYWVQRVWPRSVANALLQLWDERDLYLRTLERLPQTLCHMDVFRRNLLAHTKPDGIHETVVLDWSFIGPGALGEELVPLTVASIGFLEFEMLAGRELEEQVFTAYLDGLRDTGWSGDPQLVRLGYASAGTLRYSLGVMRLFIPFLLDESLHPMAEQFWGRPFYELCESWGIVTSRFTLRLAEEANELMDKLGYR